MIQTSSIQNGEGEKKQQQQQLATIPCKYFFVLLGDSYLAISFIDSTEASYLPAEPNVRQNELPYFASNV